MLKSITWYAHSNQFGQAHSTNFTTEALTKLTNRLDIAQDDDENRKPHGLKANALKITSVLVPWWHVPLKETHPMRTPYRIYYILVYLMLKNCESHSNVKLSIAHEYYITYSKLATLFKDINLKIVWRNIFEKHLLRVYAEHRVWTTTLERVTRQPIETEGPHDHPCDNYKLKWKQLKKKNLSKYFTNFFSQWVNAMDQNVCKSSVHSSRCYGSLFFTCEMKAGAMVEYTSSCKLWSHH